MPYKYWQEKNIWPSIDPTIWDIDQDKEQNRLIY